MKYTLKIQFDQTTHLEQESTVLAGRIAITVSGARKHIKRIGKFWDTLCWSRLVKWGKEFHIVQRYVFANELEAIDQKFRTMVLKNPYLIPNSS